MAGRPRKPTRLKVIQGNPGKRKLPEGEPTPAVEIPTRPEWLDAEAKREWNRITPYLKEQGLIAKIDRALVAMWCQCWAQYVWAVKDIEENGTTFETEKGYQGPRPAVAIATKMIEKLTSLSARFGFTPSDRAKMGVSTEKKAENPLETFLRQRAGGE